MAMLARWAAVVVRRPWWVLGVAFLLAAVAGTATSGLTGRLEQGGYEVPGSESVRAADLAGEALKDRRSDALAVYTVPRGRSVDEPEIVDAVQAALRELPPSDVAATTGWWEQPTLRSADGRTGVVSIRLRADERSEQLSAWHEVEQRLRGDDARGAAHGVDGLTLRFSGWAPLGAEVNGQTEADLVRAEMVSFPVLLVLLVVVFGGLVAAGLPLVVGAVGIVGALGVLWILSGITEVSVFAMNVVTLLGLGLAIDYGLFVVSRFREELRRRTAARAEANGAGPSRATRREVAEAVTIAMRTAGRTVLVSGLTVAAALSGLLVFPHGFLRSIGMGGIAAVVVAAIAALTVLPALLTLLGSRVDALAFRRQRPETSEAPADERGWGRVGRAVMRRPAIVTVVVVGALVLVGTPFLRAEFADFDASVLPKDNEVRLATEHVREQLPAVATDGAQVVLVGRDGQAPDEAVVQAFAAQVAEVPGVTGVAPAGASGDVVVLAVQVEDDPQGGPPRETVTKLRDLPEPRGVDVLVGGSTAALMDSLDAIGSRLPWMVAVLAGAVLVLLFLAFGSIIVPVKAVLLSALSLTASFGAVIWIFQDGHLAGPLGVEPGPIEPSLPVLMLAVLFGLSTDYELFLLSRIAEGVRAGQTPKDAVVRGLRHTGGLITAAALLLAVVVGAFASSGLQFMKLLGIGMLIAIAVDATIVRGLLVPAILALLGRAAWWAPRPLARLAASVSLEPDQSPRPTGAGVSETPEPVGPHQGSES
jgi:RND superfamily putative drug exporter